MENKEVADLLRKFANDPDGLLDAANKLDPKPVYNVGDYVNTGCGPLRVVSKEEFRKHTSYSPADAVCFFIDPNGCHLHSSGSDLTIWTPTEEEKKSCRDKDGKVCPKKYAVSQFDRYQKGVIYMANIEVPRYTKKNGDVFWLDGTQSFSGKEINERLATDEDIVRYFTTTPRGKEQLTLIVRDWVKNQ